MLEISTAPKVEETLTEEEPEAEASVIEAKKSGPLDSILDPANFSMDSFQARSRVTKESFMNRNNPQLGMVQDPSDPLSQLDPLWSLAK